MKKLIDFSKYPEGTQFIITEASTDKRVVGASVTLQRGGRADEWINVARYGVFSWVETLFVKNSIQFNEEHSRMCRYWIRVKPVRTVKRRVV